MTTGLQELRCTACEVCSLWGAGVSCTLYTQGPTPCNASPFSRPLPSTPETLDFPLLHR